MFRSDIAPGALPAARYPPNNILTDLPPFLTYFDVLIISYRGPCVTCLRNPLLRYTTDGAIGHSEGNERYLLGTDRDPVLTCKVFVRNVFVLFLGLHLCF